MADSELVYGSLCSGIKGLDLAVEATWGARPAWFCESDEHARKVLERESPGVPVYANVKTQHWRSVEKVDVLVAGYPCQPFSQAGKRLGEKDPRHLWPFVIHAIRVLGPRVVVLENVRGHLKRGFDRVLGDLADAGFDAEWTTVRASDAGACHRRERLFVVAYTDREGLERRSTVPERAHQGTVRSDGLASARGLGRLPARGQAMGAHLRTTISPSYRQRRTASRAVR
jgi:DNA (cytosine-5)-methyltransferase 1